MSAPEWRGRASCMWGGGASWWPAVRPGAPGVQLVEWGSRWWVVGSWCHVWRLLGRPSVGVPGPVRL